MGEPTPITLSRVIITLQSYLFAPNALRTMDSMPDRYNPTRVRQCWANRYRSAIVVFAVCLVCISMGVVAGVGGALSEGGTTPNGVVTTAENDTLESNVSPETKPYTISVRLYGEPPGTDLSILVETSYPARNETEAQQAENGTLDLEWFDGDDRLEQAFEKRDDSDESFEYYRPPRSELLNTSSTDYGHVNVRYSAEWKNVTTPYEPPVAELGAAFRSEDALFVSAPGEAKHTNADSESYDRGIYTYSWTLDSDNKTPELVFEEDAFESEAHGPLGPAGGIVLSVIGLLLAVHLLARNQRE